MPVSLFSQWFREVLSLAEEGTEATHIPSLRLLILPRVEYEQSLGETRATAAVGMGGKSPGHKAGPRIEAQRAPKPV